MSKLNVLLLGWEFSPAIRQKQETSCYFIAKSLAERVNLSVLLPQDNPNFILHNVELTGLNQVDLAGTQTESTQARPLPYADEPYIKNTIPLYGSSDFVSQSEGDIKPLPSRKAGAPEVLTKDKLVKSQEKGAAPANLFCYNEFEALSLDAQVIEYARYTNRWAKQRNFDIIYAYNYRTFLAGTELQLITGKKLILQVDSLSYERSNPNSKGWMHEVEKQALQQCDYIVTNSDDKAVILVNNYGISPAKMESLEVDTGTTPSTFSASVANLPDNILPDTSFKAADKRADALLTAQEKEEARWQSTADAIWEVIQMVATT